MTDTKTIRQAGWNFDNSYTRLPAILYTRQNPASANSPKQIILNEPLAASLGLNVEALQSDEGVAVLAGNAIPVGAAPLAQAYAGHQFGHFNMLGDGRALLLGEQITPAGERFDIQYKGSGRTPYSRGGDGRAAVGPMLREYIISEAMHALGIPTTRSLAVVSTGETVIRETYLPGAVLTRVAASHIRVGTFQFAANYGTLQDLQALADYTLQRHYSHVDATGAKRYLSLLQEVIQSQAALIAKWQLAGFIHGVMNTDNMAISGETIDYGPCAFMDVYDPATVFSSIDTHGRYAYANQPYIGGWNLARFAEMLLPLLHDDEKQAVELAQEAISSFGKIYRTNWLAGMRAKLGVMDEEQQDEELIDGLLKLMEKYRADYTNTFRALTLEETSGSDLLASEEFAEWRERWEARLSRQQESPAASRQLMRASNPAVIPRNHRVEEALEAAVNQQDYSVMERLLAVLSRPFDYDNSSDQEIYCAASRSSRPYRTYCGT
ncbi:YdiU family protein [Paenibacillus sp. GCM10023248]|uniref:protein adenylyltransferase SelO n=1 Tax=unclassified Paenibacillus TaxID=185978 RepID=UPI0023794279|nr:YdiU family protein [Paenibacillus sp. MAHUQ-63]MDD9268198.1 YdiU family protein [Paenibacillus sp. MAHUQ-63]